MSDPQPTRPQGQHEKSGVNRKAPESKRSLFGRLADFISHAPENRQELRQILSEANQSNIIDDETLVMIDGVVRLADMNSEDVMVPISRVDMLDVNTPIEEMINVIIDTGHSRFPVYNSTSDDEDENRQNIIGVLMAKDLLKLSRAPDLSVRALLRPAFFVPESRALNQMLADFRAHHQHMAIVVDEYGRISGVLTIEDVLEEIVGEIEDEFDEPDDEGDIYSLTDGSYRVAGETELDRFNQAFDTHLQSDEVQTIGGYIAHLLSHVPRRGESCEISGLQFTVLHTQAGVVRWFRVSRLVPRVDEHAVGVK